jgi:hypothetical protein
MHLTDIYILCQTSQHFYQFAANSSENYSVKRLFLQRARIRQQAQSHILVPVWKTRPLEPQTASAIAWYHKVQGVIAHFDNPLFLRLLEQQEHAQLELLKQAAATAPNQDLKRWLAQLAAEMVASRDDLFQLQCSHAIL